MIWEGSKACFDGERLSAADRDTERCKGRVYYRTALKLLSQQVQKIFASKSWQLKGLNAG
jgi:hypothetical protein